MFACFLNIISFVYIPSVGKGQSLPLMSERWLGQDGSYSVVKCSSTTKGKPYKMLYRIHIIYKNVCFSLLDCSNQTVLGMAPNSCNIRAIQIIATNLIGRFKGNHPSILSLTDHFPKQLKTESNIKMVPCGIDCIGLKRNIEKELFMRVPLASFHKMKLGTLLRQHFSLRWDGMNLTLSTGCKNCEELAKKVCLQNGNKFCHGGKVNMTEVMKIMKILFHLATPRDLTFLSDKVMKASFTWKTVVIDEVNFSKTIL